MNVRGWVYVLTNRAMPGLVKIGFSTKDPTLRVSELDGTGLPYSFDIEYDVMTIDPRGTEQDVHRMLASHREAKEFFKVDPRVAIDAIRNSINKNSKPILLENLRNKGALKKCEEAKVASAEDAAQIVRRSSNECPVCKTTVTGRDSRCPKCFALLS